MSKDNSINLNTYLLGGLFGLMGWLLFAVNSIEKNMATGAEKDRVQELAVAELKVRMTAAETALGELRVKIVALENRK